MGGRVGVRTLTLAAVFAALVALSTMFLKIPGPTGYYHLGDGVIYASAVLLGPIAGMAAGGLGSMLADVAGGYAVWAPWTLVIKGLAGLAVGVLSTGRHWGRDLTAMLVGAVITVAGYGLASWVMFGPAGLITEMYGNLGQTGVGILVGSAIIYALGRRLNRPQG